MTPKSSTPANVAPPPGELLGAYDHVHDPVIAKEKKNYYVFSTGPGIAMRMSSDRVTWQPPVPVFNPVPAWTATTIPGNRGFFWAPDISFFNHRWHLYYAVSTFGRNRSAIGLATNATLDPKRPDFKWVDEGPVFQSYAKDDYNAIDPNITLDEHGHPWLSFGSFWSGIRILELDAVTGRPLHPDAVPIVIATRPRTNGQPGAIEAPFIIRHGRYYYQFASFDFCCRGVRSSYNIRVGRAEKIDGPYVDADGKAMLEGGGTLVLEGAGRWKGPGHNAFLRDGRTDYLVYHSYDAEENGISKLRIQKVVWNRAGWPTVPTGP